MLETALNITDYINDQNREIWGNLSTKYNIQLEYNPFEYSWKYNIHEKDVIITSNQTDINYSSFTHELLHLYIEDNGMINYQDFRTFYSSDPIFNNFVFHNLFGFIHNFSSHKKMFPIYSKMGFNAEDFVSSRIDYNNSRHFKIWLSWKIKRLRISAIESFLGNFFALKNNVVEKDNLKCEKYLLKLKSMNPDLYKIAEELDQNWENRNDYNFLIPFSKFQSDLKNYLIQQSG